MGELGFESYCITCWPGVSHDNLDPAYVAKWRAIADYAKARGIIVSGYELMVASRGRGAAQDCIDPATGKLGSPFGQSVCLGTQWADDYFKRVWQFIDQNGFKASLWRPLSCVPVCFHRTPAPPRIGGFAMGVVATPEANVRGGTAPRHDCRRAGLVFLERPVQHQPRLPRSQRQPAARARPAALAAIHLRRHLVQAADHGRIRHRSHRHLHG